MLGAIWHGFAAKSARARAMNRLQMFLHRVEARILNISPLEPPRYLGYCREHRCYFTDLKHTGDVIRCPRCELDFFRRYAQRMEKVNKYKE